MESNKRSKALGSLATAVVIVLTMTAACSPSSYDAPQSTPTPTTLWAAMLQRTPYPYTTPLPPSSPTTLDDAYVKFDPRPGQRAPCRRCPAYPPEGGVWRLHLDKGIFRESHDVIGWGTLGVGAGGRQRRLRVWFESREPRGPSLEKLSATVNTSRHHQSLADSGRL
jgi:hypothetical protein